MGKFKKEEVSLMIDRLQQSLNIETDIELSKYLEVKQQTISAWRTRGSIDLALITAKCSTVDINYIMFGAKTTIQQNAVSDLSNKYHKESNDIKDKRINDLEIQISRLEGKIEVLTDIVKNCIGNKENDEHKKGEPEYTFKRRTSIRT